MGNTQQSKERGFKAINIKDFNARASQRHQVTIVSNHGWRCKVMQQRGTLSTSVPGSRKPQHSLTIMQTATSKYEC